MKYTFSIKYNNVRDLLNADDLATFRKNPGTFNYVELARRLNFEVNIEASCDFDADSPENLLLIHVQEFLRWCKDYNVTPERTPTETWINLEKN